MELPNDKNFKRAPFSWIDVLALATLVGIMAFSILSNVGIGD